MNTVNKSRPSIFWRGMHKMNQHMAIQVFGRGHGPGGVVLLLTTIGRKSGQPRVTPLQYEKDNEVIYVAAARGPYADWFRNIQANPHVKVQIADRVWEGLAEPIIDPKRIADFLCLRLKRHPIMMRAMLAAEGQWRCGRANLERFATKKALVAIKLLKKASSES